MGFLDLAQRIDDASKTVMEMEKLVHDHQDVIDKTVQHHKAQVEALEAALTNKLNDHKKASIVLQALYKEMHLQMQNMGFNPNPVTNPIPDPSAAELKAMILEGQKYRGMGLRKA